MDIREHVYKMIEDRGLIEYPEDEKFSELLKDVDSKLLLEDIDYFYNMWLKMGAGWLDHCIHHHFQHSPPLLHSNLHPHMFFHINF